MKIDTRCPTNFEEFSSFFLLTTKVAAFTSIIFKHFKSVSLFSPSLSATRFKNNFFASGCDLMKCMKIVKIKPSNQIKSFKDFKIHFKVQDCISLT